MSDGNERTGPALVTGAAGFIGGHLLRRLLNDGQMVTGLDVEPGRRPAPAGARVERVDVRDGDALRRLLAGTSPRVVYHLAAQASVAVSMRDPAHDADVNVTGTLRLAQAAADAGVRRFVFFSTGGALYGEPERIPVSEEMPATPHSVYGASKLAAEQYLRLLAERGAFELSVLRPGNVYGPAQDPYGEAGVVAIFAARMLRDEPVTIFGDGSQGRDYIYVDDVVEAALLAGARAPATCLLGTGVSTTTLELFHRLAALCGYRREPAFAPPRAGDIQRIALGAWHARRVWGWSPRVTLDEGLARTVEWFRREAAAR